LHSIGSLKLIADAYSRATGRRAAITYDPLRECYSGQFWEFINHLLPRVAIIAGDGFAPQNPLALGKAVHRALKQMDKTGSKKS
jgi:hypothetical protein